MRDSVSASPLLSRLEKEIPIKKKNTSTYQWSTGQRHHNVANV